MNINETGKSDCDFNVLNVLYEDNHLLVVEKPRGMLSQADSSGDADMLSVLKSYIKEKYKKPGNVFIGLVQRLDRPVGGLMVFARTSKAASRISRQIRERQFIKHYLAVVEGNIHEDKGTLEDMIVKDRAANISKTISIEESVRLSKVSVDHSMSLPKSALLDYEVLSREPERELSLVKISIHTGRSHQIRTQFAAKGHPIIGDKKYGYAGSERNIALWAYSAAFKHPVGEALLEFTCKPPYEYPWSVFNLNYGSL